MRKFKKIKELINEYFIIKKSLPETWRSINKVFIRLLFKDLKTALTLLSHTLKSVSSVHSYQKEGRSFFNTSDAANTRASDTLFILGSGPSINEISEIEWQHIKSKDSWGFNFWFCHDFIPSTYVVQSVYRSPKDKQKKFAEDLDTLMLNMLEDKKKLYERVNFIARGDGINYLDFFKTPIGNFLDENFTSNISIISECIISSKNKIELTYLLNILNSYGFFMPSNNIKPIPKFGSTIGELIPLALILGYKEIVLCGIDMNDGAHFYDNEEFFTKYPMLRTLSHTNNNRTKHEHMDTSNRDFTVKDIILAQNSFAKKHFNAKIFTMKSSSSLYPEIEKFKI